MNCIAGLRFRHGKFGNQSVRKFIDRRRRSDEFKCVENFQSFVRGIGVASSAFVRDNLGNKEKVFCNDRRPPLTGHGLPTRDNWIGEHSADQVPNDRRFDIGGGFCHEFLRTNDRDHRAAAKTLHPETARPRLRVQRIVIWISHHWLEMIAKNAELQLGRYVPGPV